MKEFVYFCNADVESDILLQRKSIIKLVNITSYTDKTFKKHLDFAITK